METILLVLSFVSGATTLGIATHAAYRLGHAAGVLAERERRMRLEAEAERRFYVQLQKAAEKNPELWETEIDA